ncbi:uncharacterized protein LOC128954783 [Oppia nitens]|uniref:uncharacterized protein LOC128954783 n=1 Tax=Oppia nitens TaxID=1686743 RepID=UPI0023DC4D93|nr:uncharacterized protein LOC128954783 [Oppia nitens]
MKFLVFGVLLLTVTYVCESASIGSRSLDDDVKKQILTQVSNLLDQARNAIDTLKKSGKSELRHGLEKAIELAKSINDKLKALNPTTEVGKSIFKGVSVIASEAVVWLESELKKVPPMDDINDDIKDLVLKQVSDSIDQTRKAIDDLKKSGKPELINGLKKTIAFVQDIEKQLQDLKPTTNIGKALLEGIQKLATIGENALQNELKNIPPFESRSLDDDVKKQILAQVSNLLDQARTAIDTLKKSGKSELKHGLEKAIELAKSINDKLKALNPTTEVGKSIFKGVSVIAQEAVVWLESELKKVPPMNDINDDIKDLVLKQVSDSIDQTRKAIDDLKKSGKPELINGLKKTIAFVQDIEKQLQDLKPTTNIGKALLEGIQKLATIGENALQNELKKIPPQ